MEFQMSHIKGLRAAFLATLVAAGASFVSAAQATTLDFTMTIDNTYYIPGNGFPSGVAGKVIGDITLQGSGTAYSATAIDITSLPAGAAGSTGPYAIDPLGSNSFTVTGGNLITNANLIGFNNIILGFNWSLAAGGGANWQSPSGCNAGDAAGFCTVVGVTALPFGDPQVLGTLTFTLNNSTSATPLPAALPLFASGLGALGLLGWRRKRKNAAAIAAA
jgi:hypothetical protein